MRLSSLGGVPSKGKEYNFFTRSSTSCTTYFRTAFPRIHKEREQCLSPEFSRPHFCHSTIEPTGIFRAAAASGPASTSSMHVIESRRPSDSSQNLGFQTFPTMQPSRSLASFARRPARQLVVWLAVCDLAVNFTFFLGSPSDGSALCDSQGFLQRFFQVGCVGECTRINIFPFRQDFLRGTILCS